MLVRVDFNVPFADDGSIADDTRVRAAVPTLRELLDAECVPILLSHFGRPKGERRPEMSLAPIAEHLSALLGAPVQFASDTSGDALVQAAERVEHGAVLLVENTRFESGEEANDPALAREWARLGTHFVNDAFGAAHRAHASTDALPRAIREAGGWAVAGRLMENELHFLGGTLDEPARPFVAIVGGAKISSKIDVIESLLPRVDRLLIGGAMANTFFLALGLEVGASLVEEDRSATARELMERAGPKLLLPVDCVVANEISEGTANRTVERTGVGDGEIICDLGDASRALFRNALSDAGTVLWNGPMGVFEVPPFDRGTVAVAEAVAEATDAGAVSILGGGDSAAAAAAAGVTDRLTHVSTGGGASLEFLSGDALPGVEALSRAPTTEGVQS